MDTQVTVSISKDITKDFKSLKVPFHKVIDLVKSDFNYSAGMFVDGHRKRDNYANYSDIIILDIDDGLSIDKASEIMKPFTHIIATTKSHQKEKNGIVCDRFRILLPCETPITLNSEQYSIMMKQVLKKFDFCDQVCKDSSRFYYPSKDSIVTHWQGFINFVWEDFYSEAIKESKEEKEKRERLNNLNCRYSNNERRAEDYGIERTKADYLRSILGTPKLLELLKFHTKFGAGSRNTYLYSIGCYLKESDLNDEEIKNGILYVNSCGDGITEQEIKQTIFRSLRI